MYNIASRCRYRWIKGCRAATCTVATRPMVLVIAPMSVGSQANQTISVATPLGDDVLLLERLVGVESVSELFRYQLDLLGDADSPVSFSDLLGQGVTVSIVCDDGSIRYLNGIVAALTEAEQVPGIRGTATFLRYRAEIVPKLWLLDRSVQSRIFQQMAVPDILAQVLQGVTVSARLQGQYKPRDYCVQYQESDFAFASRLMEDEGIFYYFVHSDGQHTMILGDTPQGNSPVTGNATVIYETVRGGTRPTDRVSTWEKTQRLRSASYTLGDYSFELPTEPLQSNQPTVASVQVGTVSHSLKVAANSSTQIYEYPGDYAKRFDGVDAGGGNQPAQLSAISPDGQRTVGIRMDQEAATAVLVEGRSRCRQFVAGCRFQLDGHFDGNGPYVLTRLEIEASLEGTYGTATDGELSFSYRNQFTCMPLALPFRPRRQTPRPRIDGPQTAVVVGPAGQEIFTDKYGRVKVKFPWNRQAQAGASASCWIRVGMAWAGLQWGVIAIPRIGHEVIVCFEDGDPDRPIIVGSVYNAANLPPYLLPDNMTRTTLKSRSSPGGGADASNELCFEDKIGSEEVYFHAQKDYVRVAENNDSLTVGSTNSQLCSDGSQTITIYKNRTETVQTGNENITISQGNRTVVLGKGNDSLSISQGNLSISIGTGSATSEAATEISLKVGSNSIVLNQQGISIQGMQVSIQGETEVVVKGAIIQLN
jgi:type VI secretion system secreted protein VgrG